MRCSLQPWGRSPPVGPAASVAATRLTLVGWGWAGVHGPLACTAALFGSPYAVALACLRLG
eukprot:7777074-Alexandrium_andersonii.AAC.1